MTLHTARQVSTCNANESATINSFIRLMCCDPEHRCHHSPCRTLGSSTGAARERRSPSGLYRNGTGCSCSKAFTSGMLRQKCYMMIVTIPVRIAQQKKYVPIGGAAENQEEEEKHQKEGNSNWGATENLSGQ